MKIAKLRLHTLEMIVCMAETCALSECTPTKEDAAFVRVKNAIRYMRENYDKKIMLDDIAAALYVNKFTLAREFKALTGQTVFEHLRKFRCLCALELIKKGEAVQDAAWRCGFSNMSFFTKTFKQYMGCLPSKYKKET